MKTVLLAALIGLGAWGVGDAVYIHAKAYLAQRLLEGAWQQANEGKRYAKPWPWADTWPIARLSVPEIDLEQFVLSGASGRVLAFGPGHVAGTALPGRGGNSVLSGHRDTHFRWLQNVGEGSQLQLYLPGGKTITYRVVERSVHHEAETSLLAPTDDEQLRLITCYPFDAIAPGGPLRYVVTAKPIRM